jgi:hypothetical protein
LIGETDADVVEDERRVSVGVLDSDVAAVSGGNVTGEMRSRMDVEPRRKYI